MITAVIDASVVTDHTGAGLAKQQMDGLKEFVKEEDLKTRLVGGSYDGAFHHDNVPRHLNSTVHQDMHEKRTTLEKEKVEAEIMEQRLKLEEQRLNDMNETEINELEQKKHQNAQQLRNITSALDTANGKLDAVEKWTTFTWDPAHLVELGDKDMKKREEGKFPKSVEKIVTEVQKGVRCGKSYMELSIEMQNENKEPRAINAFSDTRFAYEGRILNNFNHNLPGLYNHLNKTRNPLADRINNTEFVSKLTITQDVYEKVGEISKTIQDPKLFP